eukprot:c25279_g4_i1 orf=264-569(+)
MESLWIDGCYNPSWVGEKLRGRELALSAQAQGRERCKWNPALSTQARGQDPSWVGEELRRRGLATPANAQVIEPHDTNEVVPNDGVTAFVALLRACAKNKD